MASSMARRWRTAHGWLKNVTRTIGLASREAPTPEPASDSSEELPSRASAGVATGDVIFARAFGHPSLNVKSRGRCREQQPRRLQFSVPCSSWRNLTTAVWGLFPLGPRASHTNRTPTARQRQRFQRLGDSPLPALLRTILPSPKLRGHLSSWSTPRRTQGAQPGCGEKAPRLRPAPKGGMTGAGERSIVRCVRACRDELHRYQSSQREWTFCQRGQVAC